MSKYICMYIYIYIYIYKNTYKGILVNLYVALYIHVDPMMLPQLQVDKGAIKFVLSGANIMCPGLTSPAAKMDDVPENSVVVSILTSHKRERLSSISIVQGLPFTSFKAYLP